MDQSHPLFDKVKVKPDENSFTSCPAHPLGVCDMFVDSQVSPLRRACRVVAERGAAMGCGNAGMHPSMCDFLHEIDVNSFTKHGLRTKALLISRYRKCRC